MSDNPIKIEIKTPGEAIDKKTAELIEKAFGPAIEESGSIMGDLVGFVGDTVRSWRYLNRIRITKEVQRKLEAEGISPDQIRALPMREIPPVIEAISDVEEKELSELWSGLITSALTPGCEHTADRSFTSMLTQLTEADAIVFSSMIISSQLTSNINKLNLETAPKFEELKKLDKSEITEFTNNYRIKLLNRIEPSVAWLNDHMGTLEKKDYISAAENLERLGLIDYKEVRHSLSELPSPYNGRRNQDLARTVNQIVSSLSVKQQVANELKKSPIISERGKLPNFNIEPTNWGIRFASACKISAPTHILKTLENL